MLLYGRTDLQGSWHSEGTAISEHWCKQGRLQRTEKLSWALNNCTGMFGTVQEEEKMNDKVLKSRHVHSEDIL